MIDSLQSEQTILYKRLITDYQIDESVAAYACLQTGFRSVTDVIEYLFDTFYHEPSGKHIMQHPFVPFDPSLDKKSTKKGADLENQIGSEMICFLCGGPKSMHLQEED